MNASAPIARGVAAVPLPPAHACFFLDVDGTLLDLAARPAEVRMPAGLTGLLRALGAAAGGAVALVSGRTLADLDRLLAPLALAGAGQHGAERRDAAGRVHAAAADPDDLESAARRLRGLASRYAGLELEHKGLSLALHWRRAPGLGEAARAAVLRERAGLGDAWRLQEGKMVCEIVLAGHDKGRAVEAFMSEAPFRGRVPVFVGDDLTDEAGFAEVNSRGGLSVKVGPGTTQARHVLADAGAVRDWIGAWLEGRAARGGLP